MAPIRPPRFFDEDEYVDDQESDPMLRPVWADNSPDENESILFRPRPELNFEHAKADKGIPAPLVALLASAERELARLETSLMELPERMLSGSYRAIGLREAVGWLSWFGISVSPLDLVGWPRHGGWRSEDPGDLDLLDAAQGYSSLWAAAALRPAIVNLSKLLGRLKINFSLSGLAAWAEKYAPNEPPKPQRRSKSFKEGQGRAPLPDTPELLDLADAYANWRSLIEPHPPYLSALAASAALTGLRVTSGQTMLPVWAGAAGLAVHTSIFGNQSDLPLLRSEVTSKMRVGARQHQATILFLVREAAIAHQRDLNMRRQAHASAELLCDSVRQDTAARLRAVFSILWNNSLVSARDLAVQLGCSFPTALKLLEMLVDANAARETTKNASFRLFSLK